MLTRIDRIKKRLGASHFDDMESTMRLLKFMMRTSELCAPVFFNLLETIRLEASNSSNSSFEANTWIHADPANTRLHPFLVRISSVFRLVAANSSAVANAIRICLIGNEASLMAESREKEKARSNASINRTHSDDGQSQSFSRLIGKRIKLDLAR